jgi:predicted metal-dependent phosphoesterase TrpH
MSDFRADLHCHSSCSDGSLSPEELVRHACAIGLQGLSITDHDSLEAYRTALPEAKLRQLKLISGIELSSAHNNTTIHILGYSFTHHHPVLQKLCLQHTTRRSQRNQEILSNLAKLKMPISQEDFSEITSSAIGRPHIAQIMVKKGYVPSVQAAFKMFLGENKPAYAQGTHPSVEETIQAIHAANGLAVIAHPHLIDSKKIIHELLEMNFDGIECYYAKFTRDQNAKWLKIAQEKNWIKTGGSDFHGDIKPNINLGSSWLPRDSFHPLYEHYLKSNPDVLS